MYNKWEFSMKRFMGNYAIADSVIFVLIIFFIMEAVVSIDEKHCSVYHFITVIFVSLSMIPGHWPCLGWRSEISSGLIRSFLRRSFSLCCMLHSSSRFYLRWEVSGHVGQEVQYWLSLSSLENVDKIVLISKMRLVGQKWWDPSFVSSCTDVLGLRVHL